MPRAFVTGGTGFIGSHLVRRLLKDDVSVRCLVRPNSNRKNLEGLPVEAIEGNLNEPSSLGSALRGCDLLFHVAADYRLWVKDPEAMRRTNVEGTRELFSSAQRAGVKRIVFTSSVAAVGRPTPCTLERVGNETMDPAPAQLIGPYKQSKFEADRLARDLAAAGLPIVIVNPSTPIGSHDIKPTPTGKMIVDFLNGKMPGYVDTGLNFVDVEDVAEGHWLAAQKGQVGQRYILGGQNLSLKDFLGLVASVADKPAPKLRIPYPVAWMAGAVSTGLSYVTGREPAVALDGVRMAHEAMYYDASKAARELGYAATPLREAVQKAVTWFRENGYVKTARHHHPQPV